MSAKKLFRVMKRATASLGLLSLPVGAALSLSACGGGSSGPPPIVSINVSPSAVTVFSNGTQDFTATVTGASNTTVTWSVQEGATGGSITSAGAYTAPQATGTYHVVATSQADNTKSAMASVTVPPVSVSITPERDTLGPSGQRTFVAIVGGTNNTAVAWSVQEGATGGAIDANGDYVAPNAPGTFHVIVTSVADPTVSAIATTTVVPAGFTPSGSMAQGRFDHTATLLPNGKVLVVGGGGFKSGDALASAELFNPVDGTFAATGSMSTARLRHAATLLTDGKVLVTGGVDSSGQALASAELFDPATGTFKVTGHMGTARALHTGTLLATGKVLMVGGDNGAGEGLASAELFDPTSGTFTATGSIVTVTGSESHTATLLSTGKVLVGGGLAFVYGALSSAQLFDPTTGTFIATGSLTTERTFHTATLLPDGRVIFIGGDDRYVVSLATADLFGTSSGGFTSVGSMETPRAFHTATLLPDGEVLVAGGIRSFGGNCVDSCPDVTLETAEVFNPADLNFTVTGSLGTTRAHHTATLLQNGKLLVVGGFDNLGKTLASAELYH